MTPKAGSAPNRVVTHPNTTVTDTALILEGGAMRASYTSGVLVALLESGIQFDWVGGVSSGAAQGANYLSRDLGRTRRTFVEFASDPQFGGLRTLVRGQGLFNSSYIYGESGLPDQALPYDFAAFQANPAQFRIGVFEADTGRCLYWSRKDIRTRTDLTLRVQASSTLPLLMPAVHLGGHVYVDGMLSPTAGIALDAARADGYEKFLVVLTRPRDYVKPRNSTPRSVRARLHSHPAVVDALMALPDNYNRTREELFDLESSGDAMLFAPEGYTTSTAERNPVKLARALADGTDQAYQELPKWREWLGI